MNYYNPYYSSWYSPYYYGGYPSYSFNDRDVNYGRRERPSTLSTRWSGGSGSSTPAAASSRRTDIATGAVSSNPASVTDAASATSRRTVNPAYNSQQQVTGTQRAATQGTVKSGSESTTEPLQEGHLQPAPNTIRLTGPILQATAIPGSAHGHRTIIQE